MACHISAMTQNIRTSSPSPGPADPQNDFDYNSLDERVLHATKFCEENKYTQLQNLLKYGLSASLVIPQFKYKNLSRTRVPLLSIAIAYNSFECVKLLIQSDANIEAEDVFPYFFYSVSFFFFIQFYIIF